tara:strand:+ start:58 stop:555 length:498 start_codon:yes stop_codon:yes gene_type:complete
MVLIKKKTKAEELGDLGEYIIKQLAEEYGFDVILSKDPYDDEKDMFINGKTCEVKTQQFFHTQNESPAVEKSQFNKVKNAHYLFFIETPEAGTNSNELKVWQACPPEERKFGPEIDIKNRDGTIRTMIVFDRKQLNLMGIIDNPSIVKRVKELCSSGWKGNNNGK